MCWWMCSFAARWVEEFSLCKRSEWKFLCATLGARAKLVPSASLSPGFSTPHQRMILRRSRSARVKLAPFPRLRAWVRPTTKLLRPPAAMVATGTSRLREIAGYLWGYSRRRHHLLGAGVAIFRHDLDRRTHMLSIVTPEATAGIEVRVNLPVQLHLGKSCALINPLDFFDSVATLWIDSAGRQIKGSVHEVTLATGARQCSRFQTHYCSSATAAKLLFLRRLAGRVFLRRRNDLGVTSTNSSSAINSMACSRLS